MFLEVPGVQHRPFFQLFCIFLVCLILRWFLIDFASILGPLLGTQNRFEIFEIEFGAAKNCQKADFWASKNRLFSQSPLGTPFGWIYGRFWTPRGPNFDRFWDSWGPFCVQFFFVFLDPSWDPSWTHFRIYGWCWTPLGLIFDRFWNSWGSFFDRWFILGAIFLSSLIGIPFGRLLFGHTAHWRFSLSEFFVFHWYFTIFLLVDL